MGGTIRIAVFWPSPTLLCVREHCLVPHSVHINRIAADITCIEYKPSPPELCALNIQFCILVMDSSAHVFRNIFVC